MRLHNPAIAIISSVLACCYVSRECGLTGGCRDSKGAYLASQRPGCSPLHALPPALKD